MLLSLQVSYHYILFCAVLILTVENNNVWFVIKWQNDHFSPWSEFAAEHEHKLHCFSSYRYGMCVFQRSFLSFHQLPSQPHTHTLSDSPGLCGWSRVSPGTPSPHRRPGTWREAKHLSGSCSSAAGCSAGSRSPWTQLQSAGGAAASRHHTVAPVLGGTVSWERPQTQSFTFMDWRMLVRRMLFLFCTFFYFCPPFLPLSLLPYIMTLASSMKSSSHMAPSLMALMATFCSALHLPSLTRPNWPLPNSFIKVNSLGLISHFSGKREHNR